MPKGYTNAADLAKYLGREFDDNENAIADLAIGAAEIIIDRKTSVKYKETGPQTYTIYQPPSPLVVIPATGPFSVVTAKGYSAFGAVALDLLPGIHYEIRDLDKGVLWFPYPNEYYRLDVIYTPIATVPDNVKLAANVMAAHWMRPILNDEVPGLANYSIAGEFSVTFSEYVQKQGYPAEIDTLLGIPALYIA